MTGKSHTNPAALDLHSFMRRFNKISFSAFPCVVRTNVRRVLREPNPPRTLDIGNSPNLNKGVLDPF